MSAHRRELLKHALGLAGAALFGGAAHGAVSSRTLSLLNLHTGEKLTATYFESGRYVPDALAAMNHLLRDFRTGDVHPISPDLLDLVTAVSARVETKAAVQVISGYRSPRTNAMLRARSDGVATHSLHLNGQAMDLRIPGVALKHVRNAALDLGRGGVGFYPASDFVHLDVGRVRRW